MTKCWERAVPLAFHLCCFYISAVLIVVGPFSFGVYGRIWNSIVSVPDYCLLIYFKYRNGDVTVLKIQEDYIIVYY